MKDQFEVWHYDFPGTGPHPVVLISHPDRCARGQVVNVLFCTSQRQSRQPYPWEIMLDRADGLSWETFCNCSLLYAVKAESLYQPSGKVSLERRQAIRDTLKDAFLLNERD